MMVCRVEHNRRRLRMQVHVCEGPLERGRGMLFRRRPALDTAYLLQDCRAIHTVGMAFAIDVLFCDAQGRILSIAQQLRPWRVARDRRACQIWELPAGAAAHWGWRIGDQIHPC